MIDCVGVGISPIDVFILTDGYPREDSKSCSLDRDIQPGGPTATAISVLAKYGRKTALISGIGNDANALFIIKDLKSRRIQISGIRKFKKAPHPVSHILVNKKNGSRTIILTGSLPPQKGLTANQRKMISSARCVLLDGTEPHIGLEAIKIAIKNKATTVLDAGSIRETTKEMIFLADIVIGSHAFANEYAKGMSLRKVLSKLHSSGPKICGITLGGKGSIFYDGKTFIEQKAYPTQVLDTTGAGDVFHGAFIEAYLRKWSLGKCIKFATIAAGLKCREIGGRKGIPDCSEVIKLLKSF